MLVVEELTECERSMFEQSTTRHRDTADAVSSAEDRDSLDRLTFAIRDFATRRDWERFHTPKNLAMALSVEVAEVCELLQWLTPEESARLVTTTEGREDLEDELADVTIYLLRLADVLGIDVIAAASAKLERNEQRFPLP
jgi:NTP pyrophosphatase (non-canonical NTP hydrolase)